jgi:hypothetical protein
MRPRRPRPEPRLASYAGDVRVDETSPRWLQRIVYRCALALEREIRTDFPQWGEDGPPRASRGDRERDLRALLLVEDRTIPVGAVAFAWTKWSDSASVGMCCSPGSSTNGGAGRIKRQGVL